MKTKSKNLTYRYLELLIQSGSPVESISVSDIEPHIPTLIKIDKFGESQKRLANIRTLILYYYEKRPKEAEEKIEYLFSKCASCLNKRIKKQAFEILKNIPKEVFEEKKHLYYSDAIQYSDSAARSLAKELFGM